MRRVLVTGSREWTEGAALHRLIAGMRPGIDVLIVGDCRTGADAFAVSWAERYGVHIEQYRADWVRLGYRAGPERNQRMIDRGKPTEAHAYPTDKSRGTWDCVRRCQSALIPVILHLPGEK